MRLVGRQQALSSAIRYECFSSVFALCGRKINMYVLIVQIIVSSLLRPSKLKKKRLLRGGFRRWDQCTRNLFANQETVNAFCPMSRMNVSLYAVSCSSESLKNR